MEFEESNNSERFYFLKFLISFLSLLYSSPHPFSLSGGQGNHLLNTYPVPFHIHLI